MKIQRLYYLPFLLFFSALFFFIGCKKKDKGEPESPDNEQTLEGTYFITTGINNQDYVLITDSKIYAYGGTLELQRRRPLTESNYQIEGDTLTVEESSSPYYNALLENDYAIQWNGNTLTLKSEENEIILVKSSNADIPHKDEWVQPTQVEKIMEIEESEYAIYKDLTYYNGNLYSIAESGYLAKIDPSAKTLEKIPSTNINNNIGYINNHLWSATLAGGSATELFIKELDPETFQVNNTITVPDVGEHAYGISGSADNSRIYFTFYEGIRKYDVLNNKFSSLLKIGQSKRGENIAISGESLYENNNSNPAIFHEFPLSSPSSGAIGAYFIDIGTGYRINSFDFASQKIVYAIAYHYSNRRYDLFKVTLP